MRLVFSHLEGQQQEESFDTVKSPVHKVSHEEIVGLGTVAADLEELHKVVELPVYVPTCKAGHTQPDGSNVRSEVRPFSGFNRYISV